MSHTTLKSSMMREVRKLLETDMLLDFLAEDDNRKHLAGLDEVDRSLLDPEQEEPAHVVLIAGEKLRYLAPRDPFFRDSAFWSKVTQHLERLDR